jgi:hypothetical protein
LQEKLGLQTAPHVQLVEHQAGDGSPNWLSSMNQIVKKYPQLHPFFHYATKAMEKQEQLRNHFHHRLEKVEQVLGNRGMGRKSADYQENKVNLYKILLDGDMREQNFSNQELRESGYNEKVIAAYRLLRTAYDHAWKMANAIRQGTETKSQNLTGPERKKLKSNGFVTILSERQTGKDTYLVTWQQPKLAEYTVTLSDAELKQLQHDPNIQILKSEPLTIVQHALPESSGLTRGDDFYEVTLRSQKPPIHYRDGYIPHFFHEWFVMKRSDQGSDMLNSARSAKEAVLWANRYADEHPGAELVIRPKQYRFANTAMESVLVGDVNYRKLARKVSDDLEISLTDAKQWLSDKVHKKNRHRFVGNFLQRKGANGWEQDLDWVNRHYFNLISRYVAMEPFKTKAISTFERLFGQFNLEHEGVARFAKRYIQDVNGVPGTVEKFFDTIIYDNPLLSKCFTTYLDGRPSLSLAGNITNIISIAKLGMLNLSSAMLQLSQFINVAGVLDSYEYAMKGLQLSLKPKLEQRLILKRAGVDTNLSLESGAGYSKASQTKELFQASTFMFRYLDTLMRKAAVLGAYYQATDKGRSAKEALLYAKEVNRKANFEYGVQDSPNLFRRTGPIGQVVLQFKKFPIKQLELMAELVKHGSLSQNVKFWVPMLLISGMWGIPFINLLKLCADWFDWDWEKETKKALMAWAGKEEFKQAVSKTALYGLLANAGVDVSNGLAWGMRCR